MKMATLGAGSKLPAQLTEPHQLSKNRELQLLRAFNLLACRQNRRLRSLQLWDLY